MNAEEIDKLWVVVAHEKGAFHVMQMGELLEVNKLRYLESRQGYIVLSVRETMEKTMESSREIKREKKTRNAELGTGNAEQANQATPERFAQARA